MARIVMEEQGKASPWVTGAVLVERDTGRLVAAIAQPLDRLRCPNTDAQDSDQESAFAVSALAAARDVATVAGYQRGALELIFYDPDGYDAGDGASQDV